MAVSPRQVVHSADRSADAQTISTYLGFLGEHVGYALLSTLKLLKDKSRNRDSYEVLINFHEILSGISLRTSVIQGLVWRHFDTPELYENSEFKEYDLFRGLHDLKEKLEELREAYDFAPVVFLFAEVSRDWPFPPIIRLNEIALDFRYRINDILSFFQEKNGVGIDKIREKLKNFMISDNVYIKHFLSNSASQKDEGYVIEKVVAPAHPGKILEKYIVDRDWSVPYAAERLGVRREHIYTIMRGNASISTSMARALERNLIGGTALDWLMLQAKYDLAQPEKPPVLKRRVERKPKF